MRPPGGVVLTPFGPESGPSEPEPLYPAATEARLRGHGVRLSLRYAF